MSFQEKAVKTSKYLGTGHTGITLHYTSDKVDGQLADTEVKVEAPGTICWITGQSIEQFHTELQAIINKYAI